MSEIQLSNFRWVLVEGFPLLFSLFCFVLLLVLIVISFRYRLQNLKSSRVELSQQEAITRQNWAYKRGGAWLLILGAAGGFLPSLFILMTKNQVWSVNEQGPHSSVDASLLLHIPIAVIWISLVGVQLWSGDKSDRRILHRYVGWVALLAGILGIGLIGGWIWPLLNDFSGGLSSPTAGAGIYTMITGLGVGVNGILTIIYARQKNFAAHKDHALMTLFWTMDPGLHRLNMWLMRVIGGDYWAPENTAELGIAIAKLPANVGLIIWALTMAWYAGRLNKRIIYNVAGQYFLWILGTFALIQVFIHNTMAIVIAATSVILGAVALLSYRNL